MRCGSKQWHVAAARRRRWRRRLSAAATSRSIISRAPSCISCQAPMSSHLRASRLCAYYRRACCIKHYQQVGGVIWNAAWYGGGDVMNNGEIVAFSWRRMDGAYGVARSDKRLASTRHRIVASGDSWRCRASSAAWRWGERRAHRAHIACAAPLCSQI